MEQRPNDAAVKDAQSKLGKEEYALCMEQRPNDASKKDALAKLGKEEFALGMEQSSNAAAVRVCEPIYQRRSCWRHGAKRNI
jgi:PleD family two-component response regulator